ncbi:bifunctional adenosylcobinamide kinase/adenosylcobinamide-phosphate guanylyltransferase [Saccharicrinis aurantiacus]|uniref:bifunctional adenosylcobinamide kinase/adenosylcobinamide-phosphate guanylyltransferase n=1 Tax=Saccharicrinis aurantiacus TaxID=1849719 RepID=UPI0008392C9E|nr:bifunctional adenosylcobinamide kinase/adenosylcobinamide-phosphate guanylyltransferase [Saccharicrinis aurantiacus]
MAHIIFVTGGQRSGKSRWAEEKALELSDNPIYLATSRIWDDEHAARIQRHKDDRDDRWENIEEEKNISKYNFTNRVVLIDCVTLWLTNFFFDNDSNIDVALNLAKEEINMLKRQDTTFIIVTNEIGLGGMPQNAVQRKFTDLQGWMNQYIAQQANEVNLMVSGIPLKVK